MKATVSSSPMGTRSSKFKAVRVAGIAAGAVALAVWGGIGLQSSYDAGEYTARAQAPASAPGQEATLRLISQSQYVNTIQGIFGSDIAVRVRFAPVNRVDGLVAVGAGSAVLTVGGLDPLEATARAIADQVVAPERRTFLIPCQPANVNAADDQCARAFLSRVGRLLYRRPLKDNELNDVVNIAHRAVGPAGDFYAGLAYALSGMLVSPQFLYIWENTEQDPRASGQARLDGYSKAARLSFLLWNSAPDDELLSAAARGDLHDPAKLGKEVDRMIGSPLYKEGVRSFFNDFFVLEAFDTLTKDAAKYPAMTIKAVQESREQLLRTVTDHLVAQRGDYRDLYTTRRTVISSDLGVLYRLPVDTGSQGWVPYEFPANDPRAGILTQIGFLAQYSHAARSSATKRGRAIREVVLCQKVPDPPPTVDMAGFDNPNTPFKTARERLVAHNENPVCAGCHAITDPIGLALENFDGAGQFRTLDNDTRIDPSGVLDGKAYADPAGLATAVRDHPALKSCIINRLYAYSVGRKVTEADEPALANYAAVLDKKGYRFDDMLRLILLDKAFFSVKPSQGAGAIAYQAAFKGGSNARKN